MKWLRYRTCHSHGDGDWEYKPLYEPTTKKDLEDCEFFINIAEDHNWSEHWRGIEFDIIPLRQVPNKHIEAYYDDMKRMIKYKQEAIKETKKKLPLIEAQKGLGRKTCPDEVERKRRKKVHEAQMKELRKKRVAKK